METRKPRGTIKTETITVSSDTVLRPYGVGIDTHKKFIQVCVLSRAADEITSHEFEFTTLRKGLEDAQAAIRKVLGLGPEEPFAYTIESTSLYHVPILLSFGGTPSVVNPLLAGHTRRKTDVLYVRLLAREGGAPRRPEIMGLAALAPPGKCYWNVALFMRGHIDARLLARQAITGLWRPSYLPFPEQTVLRVLWNEHAEAQKSATTQICRCNGILLRYGHTIQEEKRRKRHT